MSSPSLDPELLRAFVAVAEHLSFTRAAERLNRTQATVSLLNEYFEIMVNRTKFNSLAKEQQAILQYAAEAASSANEWLAMRQYSDDLQELINKDKVNVLRTPQSVFDAQIKAWDGLITTLAADPFMKKVMDSQKEWVRKVVFYNMMNATDYKGAFNHHFPGVMKT